VIAVTCMPARVKALVYEYESDRLGMIDINVK
jgi:hypothetical protein